MPDPLLDIINAVPASGTAAPPQPSADPLLAIIDAVPSTPSRFGPPEPDPVAQAAMGLPGPSNVKVGLNLDAFVKRPPEPAPPLLGAGPEEVVGAPGQPQPHIAGGTTTESVAADAAFQRDAGSIRRTAAAGLVGIEGALNTVQQGWKDVIDPNYGPEMQPPPSALQTFRGQFAPPSVPIGTRALEAAFPKNTAGKLDASDVRTLAGGANQVEQFIGGLMSLPPSLLEPKAIAAMLISGPMASGLMKGTAYELTLQGLRQRLGAPMAAMIDQEVKGALHVGGFSGAHAALSGEAGPEIMQHAGEGAVAGLAFALPGALKGAMREAAEPTTNAPPAPPRPQEPPQGGPAQPAPEAPAQIPPTRPEARRAARLTAVQTAQTIVNDARWDNARAAELRQHLRDEFDLGAAQATRIVAQAIQNRQPSGLARETAARFEAGQAETDAARQQREADTLAQTAGAGQIQGTADFQRILDEADARAEHEFATPYTTIEGSNYDPYAPELPPQPAPIPRNRPAQTVSPETLDALDAEHGQSNTPNQPARQERPARVPPDRPLGQSLGIPDVPRAPELTDATGWNPATDLHDQPLSWQDADWMARAARQDNPARDFAIVPADPQADTWNVVWRERRWDKPEEPPNGPPKPPPRPKPPAPPAGLRPQGAPELAAPEGRPSGGGPEPLAPQGPPAEGQPSPPRGQDRPVDGTPAPAGIASPDAPPANQPEPSPTGDRPGRTRQRPDALRPGRPAAERTPPPAPQPGTREAKRGEFSPRSIREQILDWHRETTGGTPDLTEEQRDAIGNDQISTSFAGPLPGEVIDWIDRGAPGWHRRQQLFRANVPGGRGADSLASLPDYFDRLEQAYLSNHDEALATAKKAVDIDPKIAFLAWLSDRVPDLVETEQSKADRAKALEKYRAAIANLPQRGKTNPAQRTALAAARASANIPPIRREPASPYHVVDNPADTLPAGTEMSIFGTRFRVVKDGEWSTALVELDKDGKPVTTRTYLEAMDSLPVDPGSIEKPAPSAADTTLLPPSAEGPASLESTDAKNPDAETAAPAPRDANRGAADLREVPAGEGAPPGTPPAIASRWDTLSPEQRKFWTERKTPEQIEQIRKNAQQDPTVPKKRGGKWSRPGMAINPLIEGGAKDLDEQGMWSPLLRWASDPKRGPSPADQLLKAMRGAHIPADELKFSGVEKWLTDKGSARVMPGEVRKFIEENRVRLQTITLKGTNANKEEQAALQRSIDRERQHLINVASSALLTKTDLDAARTMRSDGDFRDALDGIIDAATGDSNNYDGGEGTGKGMPWDDFVDTFKDDHPHLEKIADAPGLREQYNRVRELSDQMEALAAGDPDQQEAELFGKAGKAKDKLQNAAKAAALHEGADAIPARDFAAFLTAASQPERGSLAWDNMESGQEGPNAIINNNWSRWIGTTPRTGLTAETRDRLITIVAESFNAWKAAKDAEYQRRVRMPKFEGTQHTGGTNYRERLVVLPERDRVNARDLADYHKLSEMRSEDMTPEQSQRFTELTATVGNAYSRTADAQRTEFTRHHWPEVSSNVMANSLMDDRQVKDSQGNTINASHVHEAQSDWHQQGRDRGYRRDPAKAERERSQPNGGMPAGEWYSVFDADGEYIDRTVATSPEAAVSAIAAKEHGPPQAPWQKNWHEMLLRQLLLEAARDGKDALTWSTGEMQLEKWRQLSQQVHGLSWRPETSMPGGPIERDGIKQRRIDIETEAGLISLIVNDADSKIVATNKREDMIGRSLADVVGKDQAAAIMAAPEGRQDTPGLRIGGEGMRNFYDRDLVNYARKLAASLGTTVEQFTTSAAIPTGKRKATTYTVHGIRITPEVRQRLLTEGVPAFGNIPPPPITPGKGTPRGGSGARPGFSLNPFARKTPANPAVARVQEKIQTSPGMISKAAGLLFRKPWQKFETAILEEAAPLRDAQNAILKAAGLKADQAKADPYQTLRALRGGAAGTATYMVREHMVDASGKPTGPGLTEILKPVKDDLQSWETYAYAREAQHRLSQGKNPGITQADADATVKALETPDFKAALDAVTDWNHGLLRYLKDAGGLSDEAYTQILKDNPVYIPLKRHFDPAKFQTGGGSGGGRGVVNQSSPIKKMKGSDRPILSPIDAMVQQAHRMVSIANKIAIARDITIFSETVPGGEALAEKQKLSASATKVDVEHAIKELEDLGIVVDPSAANLKGDETFLQFAALARGDTLRNEAVIWRDGKRQVWKFDPDVFRAVSDLDREYLPQLLVKIAGAPKRMVQTLATQLNAPFVARNLIRDLLSYNVQRRGAGIIPDLTATARGMIAQIRKTQVAERYHAGGTGMASINAQDLKEAGSLARAPLSAWSRLDPVAGLRGIGEVIEASPRIREFQQVWDQAKAKHGDTPRALQEAMVAAKDATTDFTRSGTLMRALSPLVPFLNARFQGADRFARVLATGTAGQRIGRMAAGLSSLTAPTVALWWLNHNKPWYQQLSPDQRQRSWYFEHGGTIYRIPKPFEVGALFASIPEEVLNRWYQKDPAFTEASVIDMVMPFSPITDLAGVVPPILLTPIETAANYDARGNRPIVPVSEAEGRPPAEQFGPYTTEAAKAAGKALGFSPRLVEHWADGWTGGAASYTAGVFERLSGKVNYKTKPGETAANRIPVVSAFVARPPIESGGSAAVNKFYKLWEQERRNKGAKELDVNAIGRFELLDGFQQAIAALRKARDDGLTDPVETNRQMFELAAEALRAHAQMPK